MVAKPPAAQGPLAVAGLDHQPSGNEGPDVTIPWFVVCFVALTALSTDHLTKGAGIPIAASQIFMMDDT